MSDKKKGLTTEEAQAELDKIESSVGLWYDNSDSTEAASLNPGEKIGFHADLTPEEKTKADADLATLAKTREGLTTGTGMSEEQIRASGAQIDVPFETPDPGGKPLAYGEGEAETWTPPAGLKMGGVAWGDLPPIGQEEGEGDVADGESAKIAEPGVKDDPGP